MNKKNMLFIEKQIGYKFQNKGLLEQAFTRRSFSVENGGGNNETLEFFGDKVLDFCVARRISYYSGEIIQNGEYFAFGSTEKELTNLRNSLVKSSTLAKRIDYLGFSDFLRMSKGDLMNNVQNEQSVKEDLFEAILGAVAIDCNWDVKILVNVVELMLDIENYFIRNNLEIDYVVEIERWVSKNMDTLPKYIFEEKCSYTTFQDLIDIPVCGDKTTNNLQYKYSCGLDVGYGTVSVGYGNSKSKARIEAAKKFYNYLNEKKLLNNIIDEIGEPNEERAINQLNELSQKGYIEEPIYDFEQKYDKSGSPIWRCICRVENYNKASKWTSSKRDAKKHAAYLMVCIIVDDY